LGNLLALQKRIKDLNELAIYVHCCAHVLNLCVVDVSGEVVGVRNMFGVLSRSHSFIEAPSKRHAVFESIQKKSENIPSIKPPKPSSGTT
jgi:hypothetical protein